jgi:hypothetical protein
MHAVHAWLHHSNACESVNSQPLRCCTSLACSNTSCYAQNACQACCVANLLAATSAESCFSAAAAAAIATGLETVAKRSQLLPSNPLVLLQQLQVRS